MSKPTVNIKKSQKESLLFKEVSTLYSQASLDDPRLSGIFISRVKLSDDKGICYVYFYTPDGEEKFNEVLKTLVLYKASLRKALASKIKSRYTPELIFKFDSSYEKAQRLESLLDSLKGEYLESTEGD